MELGFLVFLGGLFLVVVFLISCVVSLKRVSSEDLAEEYLKVGLRELKIRLEKQLEIIEEQESELNKKLADVLALERLVSEKLEVPSNRYLLVRGDLKDAV